MSAEISNWLLAKVRVLEKRLLEIEKSAASALPVVDRGLHRQVPGAKEVVFFDSPLVSSEISRPLALALYDLVGCEPGLVLPPYCPVHDVVVVPVQLDAGAAVFEFNPEATSFSPRDVRAAGAEVHACSIVDDDDSHNFRRNATTQVSGRRNSDDELNPTTRHSNTTILIPGVKILSEVPDALSSSSTTPSCLQVPGSTFSSVPRLSCLRASGSASSTAPRQWYEDLEVDEDYLSARQMSQSLEDMLSSRCTIQDLSDPFMKAGLLIESTVSRMRTVVPGDHTREAIVRVLMSEHVYIHRGELFGTVEGREAVNERYLLHLIEFVVDRIDRLDEQAEQEEVNEFG